MVGIMNVILVSIAMTVVVSATPRYLIKSPKIVKQDKLPVCLPLGKSCMTSKFPCCTLSYKESYLGLGLVPTTCFKFGKGICQVNQRISNFDKYVKLAQQLNSTNFQELKDKYWSSVNPAAYTCPQKVTFEVKSV